jgi:hypothetical protein
VELSERRVRARGPDPLVFHPQTDFFGTVAPGGVVTVLVSGLEQPENYLLLETTGLALRGNVVRIEDASPHEPLVTLEDVDGAKITTVRDLGVLDSGGLNRRVIGRIDETETLPSSAGGGGPATLSIADTDRYEFHLPAPTLVGVKMNRRYDYLGEGPGLADPFFAVMSPDDLPDAFDYNQWGFGPTTGPCWDPTLYNYPIVMPGWVAAQANLIADPSTAGSPYSPVASVPGSNSSLGCALDHDADGIADLDEPTPQTLIDQILQRQAENLAIDPDWYLGTFDTLAEPLDVSVPFFDATFVDVDSNESPDDLVATSFRPLGIGGRSTALGEDAVWVGYLPSGAWRIVVGDGAGTVGPYDLEIRVLEEP